MKFLTILIINVLYFLPALSVPTVQHTGQNTIEYDNARFPISDHPSISSPSISERDSDDDDGMDGFFVPYYPPPKHIPKDIPAHAWYIPPRKVAAGGSGITIWTMGEPADITIVIQPPTINYKPHKKGYVLGSVFKIPKKAPWNMDTDTTDLKTQIQKIAKIAKKQFAGVMQLDIYVISPSTHILPKGGWTITEIQEFTFETHDILSSVMNPQMSHDIMIQPNFRDGTGEGKIVVEYLKNWERDVISVDGTRLIPISR